MAKDFGTYTKGDETRAATSPSHAVNLEARGWKRAATPVRKSATNKGSDTETTANDVVTTDEKPARAPRSARATSGAKTEPPGAESTEGPTPEK